MAFQNLQAFLLGLFGRSKQPRLRCTGPISAASGGATTINVDLSQIEGVNANFIEAALSMYCDNGGNANDLVFTFSSGQQIDVPANTAGYYNILQPNPMRFSVATFGVSTAYFMLINEFVPANNWTATKL